VIGHPAAFALQWLSANHTKHNSQASQALGNCPNPTLEGPCTDTAASCTAAATTVAAGLSKVECQTLSPVVMHTALTRGKSNS